MAKTSNKRIKAATLEAPQTLEQTQSWIKELGDTQREHARVSAALNDQIAALTEEHKPALNALTDRIKELQQGGARRRGGIGKSAHARPAPRHQDERRGEQRGNARRTRTGGDRRRCQRHQGEGGLCHYPV